MIYIVDGKYDQLLNFRAKKYCYIIYRHTALITWDKFVDTIFDKGT